MDEIQEIWKKYDNDYVSNYLNTTEDINQYAIEFYKDVANIHDALTRLRNVERNSTGFDFDDAPILGLLTRSWKMLKQVIRFYEEDNAEFISVFERPLIVASVIATYLMKNGPDVVRDYRLCSYKDRLRILRDLESGSKFFDTKAGKRLLKSVKEKLSYENLDADSFAMQKKNCWRLQGKTFFDIFSEVVGPDLYACVYGMMSESIHGSWNESLDFGLSRNGDGTFSTYPFHQPADLRFVSPTIRFANLPYRPWLKRIDIGEPYFSDVVDWIDKFNATLFCKFDELYDDHATQRGA